jgi:hypothetical protein
VKVFITAVGKDGTTITFYDRFFLDAAQQIGHLAPRYLWPREQVFQPLVCFFFVVFI